MVFSSLIFLLYFMPVSLIGYFLFGFSVKLQNIWLFLVSIAFYAWGEPSFVIIMLVSIFANWIFGLLTESALNKSKQKAKIIVFLDVIFNLSILFVFKYLNFFVDNVNTVAGKELLQRPNLALPIGISFFTFQALSYVVDVYRGDAKVQKSLLNLGLYIAFFPQLVAGPIVRYNTIEQNIYHREFDLNNVINGTSRFAIGVIKKVLLANNFAIVADTIFDLMKIGTKYDTTMIMAWTGVLAYYFQLFFDFSSYSDMAIGLGRIFGFEFEENFNYPYISKSIGELWRRWHISLGTWFKEYVYFPLGGSRVENQDLMVKNTIIVWLLTGLWHGASWTFILWGLYQFLFIILERLINYEKMNIPGWIKILCTQFIFLMSLVMFRCDDLYLLKECFKDMFMANGNSFCNGTSLWVIKEYWMFYVCGFLVATPIVSEAWSKLLSNKTKVLSFLGNLFYCACMCAGMTVAVVSLVRGGYNPFIYFNF
ncbi:MAG: MBOAT family protein [Butyrivibrio sp.]|nr:MBOAT family protein [Butyrivibrio sp.]